MIDLREIAEPGDIVNVRGNDLGAKLIRFWTSSKYSHSAIYCGVLMGQPLIIEATLASGINIDSLDKYESNQVDVFRLKAPLAFRENIPVAASRYLLWAYSKLAILGFVISKLTGSRVNPFQEEAALICSELINRAVLNALAKLVWSAQK